MRAYPDFDTMPIGKRWRAGAAGENRTSTDPWSGDTLATIPQADTDDLDEVYAAAANVQRDWAAQPPMARAD
jgi:aldehyde dehydrogenase (NAD+)